ncbi:DUF4145 domain-containing protein [uncultured Deefgea sp.]|uniref:DUF4145 domain-containing protein n=1 Tax=uncultured Deefgea sp. TaxID=1304914 RepID=UPI00262A1EE6|nr:DUF4145 domain-containing protein [uncultured Deefgea sp.]
MSDEIESERPRYKRTNFIKPIPESGCCNLSCPFCYVGILYTKNITSSETEKSKLEHDDPSWEVEWIESNFSAVLNCKNCSNEVFCLGDGRVSEVQFEDEDGYSRDYVTEYKPKYFHPPIPQFLIAEWIPSEIKVKINDAFALAYCDFASCGNKLRVVVEEVMNSIDPDGKGVRLHKRIEALKEENEKIKEFLMAIKWLGNEASHEGELQEYEVAFAFKTLKLILDKVFIDPSIERETQELKLHAQHINRDAVKAR